MLEKKIYKLILVMTIFISLFSIVGNAIIKLPLIINLKWIVLLLVSIVSYVKEQEKLDNFKFIYFIVTIVVIVPLGYIDSGGASNTISYMFMLLISTTYLFKSTKQKILVTLNILVFIVLHLANQFIPNFVRDYSSSMKFTDVLLQVPLVMIASYLLLRAFLNAYDNEKKIQKDYSDKLQIANEKLDLLAHKDELTELFNRRVFNNILNDIFKLNTMRKESIYIVIFDMDNFKAINDNLGHLVGDELLVSFAKLLKRTILKPNIVCRWGGDEFALIYYGDMTSLDILLNKIKYSYAEITRKYHINSSLSFGGIKWSNELSVEKVLSKADTLLYESKKKGRGLVTLKESVIYDCMIIDSENTN